MSTWSFLRRNRWFILAALFLVVNTYGVVRLGQQNVLRRTRVADFEAGQDGIVNGSRNLKWTFSTDMVLDASVGEWVAQGPATFSPATPGRFCWISSRELCFEPAEPWPACTQFTAEMDRNLADRQGYAIASTTRFHFRTSPLRLLSAKQTDFAPERTATLRLEFNAPPLQSRLKKHLRIRDDRGRTIDYTILGNAVSRTLFIRTRPILTESFLLALKRGMPSVVGPLASETDVGFRLNFVGSVSLLKLVPKVPSFETTEIQAHFSAPIVIESAQEFITVSPSVDFSVVPLHGWNVSGCCIRGDFLPGMPYTITFRGGLPAANGRTLSHDVSHQLVLPARAPGIRFTTAGQYLTPRGRLEVPLAAVNVPRVTVTAERVYPNNLVVFAMREAGRYEHYRGRWSRNYHEGISRRTGHTEIPVVPSPDKIVSVRIPMKELMGDTTSGAYLLTVSAEKCTTLRRLVIVTDIGISVKRSRDGFLVWANSIRSLDPIADAAVRVYSTANQEIFSGVTDADGLVSFTTEQLSADEPPFLVVLRREEQISYLKLDGTEIALAGDIGGAPFTDRPYQAYVYTDRGIYRPGEHAHARVIVRDQHLAVPDAFPILLSVTGPDGQEVRRLPAELSPLGTTEFDVAWPDCLRMGRYTLAARLPGTDDTLGSATVALEEFVPPRIKVDVEIDDARLQGDLQFRASAEHLFGRPAAGRPVTAQVRFSPAVFSPAKWPGYNFSDPEKSFAAADRKVGSGCLDPDGHAHFATTIPDSWRPPSALTAHIAVTVTETGGRTVSAYASRPVDVYPRYVGLRRLSEQSVVRTGEPLRLAAAAVRPDGTADADLAALELRVVELSWSSVLKRRDDDTYVYESQRHENLVMQETLALNRGQSEYSFTPPACGQYLLTVKDPDGGSSASIRFYAGSAEQPWMAWSMAKPDTVTLESDKTDYRPGDEAQVVIKAPFAGKALLTLETDRVLESRVLAMDSNTAEVRIPLDQAYGSTVYCAVSLIRPVSASLTAYRAVGVLPLRITRPEHRLQVDIQAPEAMRPKSSLQATLHVTDAFGKGVPAEITVAAVDEGICMLTAFQTPDPLKFFERKRALGVTLYDVYSFLMPDIEEQLEGTPSLPGGGMGAGLAGRLNPIQSRRFKPVALWKSGGFTDSNGWARVSLDVPEFTGMLRVMAVAVAANGFGSAQAPVFVKRPLIVLSSLPRFLAPGDQASMAIRIFNETAADADVRLAVTCRGPLSSEETPASAPVAKGDTHTFHARLQAGDTPGVAHIGLHVEGGVETYDEVIELPVRPASPRVTRSDFGAVQPGRSVDLSLPSKWLPGTVDHQVRISGLPTVKLAGGLDYLVRYPYGCLEQTTSSAFPLLSLDDLAARLQPELIDGEGLSPFVEAGIVRILSMQQADGSFGYWPNSTDTYRWGTVYASHFLVEANNRGYDVPRDRLDAALKSLASRLGTSLGTPANSNNSQWQREICTRAYVGFVLALAHRAPEGWLTRMEELWDRMDSSAQVNLAAALAQAGYRRRARERLRMIGVSAPLDAPRQTAGCLNTPTRNAALLLSTWLDVDPDDSAVPLLVRQLETLKRNGSWGTTQDNAMALLALGKYCRRLKRDARGFDGEVRFETADGVQRVRVDATRDEWVIDPAPGISTPVHISNYGPGALYYMVRSLGIRRAGDVQELDRRLRVRRDILNAQGTPSHPEGLTQGELVVVTLSLDTLGETLNNLVVEDLLPAGLEVENANLKTSAEVPWAKARQTLAVQHVDIRDDRVLLFVGSLHGRHTFHYAARVVTPGKYTWPPVGAECMYDPEIRSVSRSPWDSIEVSDDL